MNMFRRWTAALLSLVLLLGMMPMHVHAGAEEVPAEDLVLMETGTVETVPVTEETTAGTVGETEAAEEETEPEETTQPELVPPDPITLVRVNPLYADITDDSEWPVPALMTLGVNDSCTNVEEIAEVLREGMVARQEVISIDYSIKIADYDEEAFSIMMSEAVDLAMAHTGEPTEGDYIQWQYKRWQCSASASGDGTYWYFTLTYMLEYGTDAEQEAEMDTAVANLLSQLNPTGSDYNKIRTVYDYMTENIAYDYDNLNDSSYFLKHTAYAALINKTAVCQGYAVLLYRLALEMGIDCRVITGTSHGEGHAWNIVELENKYYNLDSTWDAGETAYTYFLKSQNNFLDHSRDEDYTTSSFNAKYPMGTEDYAPSEEPEPTEPHVHSYTETVTAPTCTAQGYTTYTCGCGESYVDSYVNALGHSFGEWQITKEPTTEAEGEQRRDCANCDAYETQVIEKLPEETVPEETVPDETTPQETVPEEFEGEIFTVSGDLSISGHSQDDISRKYASIVQPTSVFAENPSVVAPYAAGKLSDSLLQNGLTTLNYFRYVTRLPQVQLSNELNEIAQHGAVVMAANDQLSHYPAQPADMEDSFYEKGYAATTTSNISWNMGHPAVSSISVGLHGCLWDKSDSNISRLGHRRWLLNPRLLNVGLGYAQSLNSENYSVTKVFDQSGAAVDYDFVAFPASGNFPTNLFTADVPWSVTLNPQKFVIPELTDLTVTITRKADGTSWILDASTGSPVTNTVACLGVDYGGYGISNCIIFTPGAKAVGSYNGLHTVEITGLETKDGDAAKLLYEVNFFDVTDVEPEPTEPEETTAPTETEHVCDYVATVINPTCTEQGYTSYTCSICGETYKDDFTDAIGHKWKVWFVTRGASTTEEGEAYRECSNCSDKDYTTLEKLTEEGRPAVVITDGAGIRPDASAQGQSLGNYVLGAIITVYETVGDWIRTGEGWVALDSVDAEDVYMSDEERILRRGIEDGLTDISVDKSFTLVKDLYIPEGVYLNIEGGCTMTVPAGVTLDVGGWITIYDGALVMKTDSILELSNEDWAVIDVWGGSLDVSDADITDVHQNAVRILKDDVSAVTGIDENMLYANYFLYSMADVNTALAQASRYGYVQMDVMNIFDLTNSITIPKNALLNLYYTTFEVAALDGVTVTNNGDIWVQNGNMLSFAQGSRLVNNGYLYVDDYSLLLMLGTYSDNGILEGAVFNGYISQSDLEEALDASAGYAWIHPGETIITRDLTVDIPLGLYRFGKLTVSDGVTLTMNSDFALFPGAEVIVEDGGTLILNGATGNDGTINIKSGGTLIVNGTWEGNDPVYDHVHAYSKTVTRPTCTEQGYTTYTCTCGDSYVSDYVAATGHSYDDGKVTTRPGCETRGIRTYSCSCGHTYTEEIPAAGHAYTAMVTKPTCTEQGYTTYTCDNCGSSYVNNYTDALGHTDVTDPAVAATCTESGLAEGKHCSVCGEILMVQTEIPALGHSFGNWYVTREATTEAEGEERRDCDNCDEYETRMIEKLPEGEIPTEGKCGDNLTWEFDAATGKLTITGTGEMYAYCGPDPVPWDAFKKEIRAVHVEDGVTSTGYGAFSGCVNLTEVRLPEEMKLIGEYTFSGCTALTGVRLPDTLEMLGTGAFMGCTSLTEFVFPEDLGGYGPFQFEGCTSLVKVTFPGNAPSILSGQSFLGCSSLKEIIFQGNAPEEIAPDAFEDVTAEISYPADNATWTTELLQNYGGNITWNAVAAGCGFQLGDVNHDGKINAKDATLILQKSVGVLKETAKFCQECAEVSGDGRLNAKDSTLILQFSVGLRDSFPAQKK